MSSSFQSRTGLRLFCYGHTSLRTWEPCRFDPYADPYSDSYSCMADINLKKLILKEFTLIQQVVHAIDPDASIQTVSGLFLLGNGTENHTNHTDRYPITFDETILGWVNGDEKAEAIATLINRLVHREQEKRSLTQELLNKYKEISLLFSLSEKIIDRLDVQDVAALVLEEAQPLLKSTNATLFLRQENAHHLERIVNIGNDPLFQPLVPIAEGIIGHIVQVGRGEIINTIQADPRHIEAPSPSSLEQKSCNALICVPLKSKGATIGAIALSRPQSQPYHAEEFKLLTTLAYQAAGAINALLHERQLKESRQNALIFRLSSQIRESLELDTILAIAVSEIYRALNLDRCCFLWSRTPEQAKDLSCQPFCAPSHVVDGLDIVTESKRASLAPLVGTYPKEVIGQLVQWFDQQQLVNIGDISLLENDPTRHFLERHNFSALLAIPIQTRSGQTGALCCGSSHSARTWSDNEVALLQAVTNQLAIALDQAELYEQSRNTAQLAQRKAEQLEAALEELQQTQLHLVHSEKMSSIGQMVAGIAHEINNPMTFIHGNLEYARRYIQSLVNIIQLYQTEYQTPSTTLQDVIESVDLPFLLEDLPNILRSMTVGTERIREIVLSLKIFSRLDQAEFKTVDIHEGLDSTLMILKHRLKSSDRFPGIQIVKAYGNLPRIECYPGQINQVFMNILTNAIDALEEANTNPQYPISTQALVAKIQKLKAKVQDPPTITIRTQQINQNCIQIGIADNGFSIPPEIQRRLFDPFFTTKEVGKGTGLGLSISYQIITERHGGSLHCHSAPGQGTEFVIEIPICQGDRENVGPMGNSDERQEGVTV